MGTVQYLAPEQATGKPATAATDVYALGVVAYEALAGRRPFSGDSQMVIAMAHINDAPPALPEFVDSAVAELVLECLAKKPEHRPANALILAQRAEALLNNPNQAAATRVMSQVESTATTVLRTDTSPLPGVVAKPIVWPWIAVISILAVTAVAILVAIITGLTAPAPSISPTTTASTTPSATASNTVTPSATPTSETVILLAADVDGKDITDVESQLATMGLVLDAVPGTLVSTDSPLLYKAYDASPLGTLELGSTVTVYYYAPAPETATPTPTPTASATPSPTPSASPSVTP
jgi:serine/threonine-protein kinase